MSEDEELRRRVKDSMLRMPDPQRPDLSFVARRARMIRAQSLLAEE